MHLSWKALLLASAVAVSAVPRPSDHVVHEKRQESRHWTKLDRVKREVQLPVRIGLVQSNLDVGHDMLMDISHPQSSKYAQYLTAEQIHELFAPSSAAVEAVREWLVAAGIQTDRISQSVNKQWLQFDAATEEVEELLKAEFHFYEHKPSGRASIATDAYHVPKHVSHHIDYITPGIKLYNTRTAPPAAGEVEKRSGKNKRGVPSLPPLKAQLPMPLKEILALGELQACGAAITPPCIAAMYNITKGTMANPTNQLGIFEDLGDYYSQVDLNEFFATLYPDIPVGTHPQLDGIDGGFAPTNNLTDAGGESDLDFQISYPIIWPQNSILFQTDDSKYEANYTYDGFLNNFLDAIDGSYCSYSAYGETGNSPLDPVYPDPQPDGYKGILQCGVYQPTNVISISYGGQEADLPMSYQRRQCAEFMKLGLRGISIVVASGDNGVAGPTGDDSSDGCLGNGQIFSPDFPATCPYLTTAGATLLPPTGSVYADEETAVTRFGSGGGFSNIYPIPSYQQQAVKTYLTQHTPSYKAYSTTYNQDIGNYGGIYNNAGRGYPDVSAVGDNVVIFNQGAPTLIGGTSAAAPVFAAVLTRINEERLAVGKNTIGFVNPVLYAHPEILHDITVGNNPGCGTNGFNASVGWDPLTGLGTPNYEAMLVRFLSLP